MAGEDFLLEVVAELSPDKRENWVCQVNGPLAGPIHSPVEGLRQEPWKELVKQKPDFIGLCKPS